MVLLLQDKSRIVLLVILLVLALAFEVLALDEQEKMRGNLDTSPGAVAGIVDQNHPAKAVLEEKVTDILEPAPLQFDNEVETKPEQEQERNPFAFTDRLRRAVANGDFSPMQNSKEMPPMHLRGLIKGNDGDLVALLEIEKAIHIVRAGDTVGLNDLGINTVIRIKKINRLNIIIETGTMGQLIIVR